MRIESLEDRAVPAAIYTVTTNANSGAGSFHQAITDANANPGADRIEFDLPAGATVISPTQAAPLPAVTDPVTIDGYTQPGTSVNTLATGTNAVLKVELNGAAAQSYGLSVYANGGGSVLRGLVVNNFASGPGIYVYGGDGTRIEGNFIGTDAAGAQARGNNGGITLENAATETVIGGTDPAARNLVSGNTFTGVFVVGNDATPLNTQILGNLIGTDATGTADLGNGTYGIWMSAGGNTIGGPAAGAGNVISGNDTGILLSHDRAVGNTIQGNRIGTTADGTGAIPNTDGVVFGEAAGTVVTGNTIAHNVRTGLQLKSGVGNTLSANAIFDNGGPGIDLGFAAGVTPNDAGDEDTGANDFQNFPVLTAVTLDAGTTRVAGTLNSAPDARFRLEFFASGAADASGHGEGERYLGAINPADVLTDENGDAVFTFLTPTQLAAGQFVTATATDAAGNTSEFSASRVVPGVVARPTVQFASAAQTVAETGRDLVINVLLSPAVDFEVTVPVTVSGSAAAGADFTLAAGSVVIPAGATSGSVTVSLSADTTDEADETVILTLGESDTATLGALTDHTVTITDDDLPPTVSVADVTVTEPGFGTAPANFVVTLSEPSGKEVTVNALAAPGTAGAADFDTVAAALTFMPGETNKTVAVPVRADLVAEAKGEHFFLDAYAAVNATIADGIGKATVFDAGTPVVTVLSAGPAAEGSDAVFTVSLSGPTTKAVRVAWAPTVSTAKGGTPADTATRGADFATAGGVLTFAPGETEKTVRVPVYADAPTEPDETFTLALGTVTNAKKATSAARGTIADGPPLTVSMSDSAPATEGAFTGGDLVYTVTLSRASSRDVKVSYATPPVPVQLAGKIGYVPTRGLLTFKPGEVSKTVRVKTRADDRIDPGEVVDLRLSAPVNAGVLDGVGTGVISDAAYPTVSVADAPNVREGLFDGGTAVFPVTLSRPVNYDVTVRWATNNGTHPEGPAAGGFDYEVGSGLLTFKAGETTKIIEVRSIYDLVSGEDSGTGDFEAPGEYFAVTLSRPVGARVTDGYGQVGIIDNGINPTFFKPTIGANYDDTFREWDDLVVNVRLPAAILQATRVDVTPGRGWSAKTVIFQPGETDKEVRFRITPSDSLTHGGFELIYGHVYAPWAGGIFGFFNFAENNPLTAFIEDPPERVPEGGEATFKVKLSRATNRPVTVSYQAHGGLARPGRPFETIEAAKVRLDVPVTTGTVTFAPGETVKEIRVLVHRDSVAEGAENFFMKLTPTRSDVPLGDAVGEAIISDNFRIVVQGGAGGRETVVEGLPGQDEFQWAIELSDWSDREVRVDWYVTGRAGSAVADLSATRGTLVFAPGETRKFVAVTALADGVTEGDEEVGLYFKNAVNATIFGEVGGVAGLKGGLIFDRSSPFISAANPAPVREGDGQAVVFSLTLAEPVNRPVTVRYATRDGGATGDPMKATGAPTFGDYTHAAGTVTFQPGEVRKDVAVRVADDWARESDEAFFFDLSHPTLARLLTTTAVGTILDNADPALEFSVGDATVTEGDPDKPKQYAEFTVSLSGPVLRPTTVKFETHDGTGGNAAIAPRDYLKTAGTLTFLPGGPKTQTVRVAIVANNTAQIHRTFELRLSAPGADATLLDPIGLGNIFDDD